MIKHTLCNSLIAFTLATAGTAMAQNTVDPAGTGAATGMGTGTGNSAASEMDRKSPMPPANADSSHGDKSDHMAADHKHKKAKVKKQRSEPQAAAVEEGRRNPDRPAEGAGDPPR